MRLKPGQTLGPYRIERFLGRGGLGEVYLATDMDLRRHVAIKTLRQDVDTTPGQRVRLLAEARTAAQLNHPNICTIHSILSLDDLDIICMEFIDGKTLHEELADEPGRSFSISKTLVIAIAIATGLHEAHQHHLLHGDLSAANVMLTRKGALKLLDFGLARILTTFPNEPPADGPQFGEIAGTLQFMSPEQLAGDDLDYRSDLYSVGVLLYYMLAGRLPFARRTPATLLHEIRHLAPPPIRTYRQDVPSDLDVMISELLAKDRIGRPPSVQVVLERLQKLQHEYGEGPTIGLLNIVTGAGYVSLETRSSTVVSASSSERWRQARTPEKVRIIASYLDALREMRENGPYGQVVTLDLSGTQTGFSNWRNEDLYKAILVENARYTDKFKMLFGETAVGVKRRFFVDLQRLTEEVVENIRAVLEMQVAYGLEAGIIYTKPSIPPEFIADIASIGESGGLIAHHVEAAGPLDEAPQAMTVKKGEPNIHPVVLERIRAAGEWASNPKCVDQVVSVSDQVEEVVQDLLRRLRALETRNLRK